MYVVCTVLCMDCRGVHVINEHGGAWHGLRYSEIHEEGLFFVLATFMCSVEVPAIGVQGQQREQWGSSAYFCDFCSHGRDLTWKK